jgi:membrane protein DedA with SNARE-associated domain
VEALAPVWSFFVAHAYAVIFVATVIDATGIPFPGRLLLIAAGAYAATGGVDVSTVIVLGTLGASVGDHTWYVAGRLAGDRLISWICRLTFSTERCFDNAKLYYRKFGPLAIVVGRFVAGVRIFSSPLAARCGIGYPRFLAFDLLGALLWSGLWVLLGYAVGDRWPAIAERLGGVQAALAFLLLTSIAGIVAFRLWRRRRETAELSSGTRAS